MGRYIKTKKDVEVKVRRQEELKMNNLAIQDSMLNQKSHLLETEIHV